MPITPKAIQDLLDELEASKQSRLRAWNVLQRLRLILSESGNVAIPPPAQKTFDAEGEVLERQNRGDLRQWMPWLDETKSPCDTLNFIRRSLIGRKIQKLRIRPLTPEPGR
jgi:hypothetical protein